MNKYSFLIHMIEKKRYKLVPALPICHFPPHHQPYLTTRRDATVGACSPSKKILWSTNIINRAPKVPVTSRISLGVDTVISPWSDTLLQQKAVIPS